MPLFEVHISAQLDWVLLKKTMNRDADQADEQTTTDPNVTNRHHSVSKLVNLADRYTSGNTNFYLEHWLHHLIEVCVK